jgi:ribose transport system ATP-binding protein
MNVRENVTLPRLGPLQGRLGWLGARAERRDARRWMRDVGVVPAEPERALGLFSGGNQQKVMLAKWLRTGPRVLLLDEPTQGVDVGAKSSIYALLAHAAVGGTAVLMASSDNRELAQVCDRVLVLRDGRVAADLDKGQLSEPRLVAECLGADEPTLTRR